MTIDHPNSAEIILVIKELEERLMTKVFWNKKEQKDFDHYVKEKSKELDFDFKEALEDGKIQD